MSGSECRALALKEEWTLDHPLERQCAAQLVLQVARPELRADGFPVAVDHIFLMCVGGDPAKRYPLRITIETAVVEGRGEPVLTTLEQAARRMLSDTFLTTMDSEFRYHDVGCVVGLAR